MSRTATPPSCHPERKHQAKGLCSKCYDKRRYAENPEKRNEPARRWYLRNKNLQVQRSRQWGKTNKAARKRIVDRYRAKNLPRFAFRIRRLRKAYPERYAQIKHMRRAREGFGEDCRAAIVLLRQQTHCHWCEDQLTPQNFSIDHVVPLSRNGRHEPQNLVASCLPCNWSKGSKLLEEWNGR